MDGFVWSLMSAECGGFLDGADVTNVKSVGDNILVGTVTRNFNGTYKTDTEYEFFVEQFIPLNTDIWKLTPYYDVSQRYHKGDQVEVFARQCWGAFLPWSIAGTVYQDQISGSVIVSVDPDYFSEPTINSTGGFTLEVYPQQLRRKQHNEVHPILGWPDAAYTGTREGFRRAKQYRRKKENKLSWIRRFLG